MQSKTFKKALSLVLSIAMLAVSVFTGVTVSAEDGVYNASRINIHPGIDDTFLNFSWQSDEQAAPATVRMKAEGSDTWLTFTGESKAFVIKDGYEEGYHDTFVKNCGHTCADVCGHEACTASQCYHGTYTKPYYNMVTASNLEYGVNYVYQLGDGTNWSKEYTISVADSDPNEGFSYLVFGDSQTADQYYGDYMKKALELATDKFSDIDFLLNLGDNVHENNDRNYNAYYTAQDVLASYPIAVVLGNHELNLCTNGDRINFSDHPALALQNPPAANGRQDHWFRYGDVLFITFNSGPQQTSMMADLEQLIIDAKAAHPDTRWTILQTHQGFYANNGGGKVWRKDFTSIISKYDIDLVFNGHHHMYTRTESLVYDSTLTCSHEKSNPYFSCAACSGSVEPLGENDVTVKETFVGAKKTTEPYYEELEGVEYDKTTVRYDPEGVTYIHLDSLTAEGHDQYATIAGSSLAATNAFSINTKEGQGAITKVTVGKDANGNDTLSVETYWINNNGTPRTSDSKPLSLLDDDYVEDTPYDTYTIVKTTPVKDVEVTFDGGADRSIFTRKINSGEAVAEPANPVMTGKSFKYWSLDGETEYNFAEPITEDITLTAVYEDIPPTTTEALFIEAINRGDSEIILAGDITLTEVITFNNNVTVKSAEGQKYTLTLDGAARLVVAKGKKVTLRDIGITIASTANTISNAYDNGTYITVGSGGSRADLYVYNCTIKNLLTDMGSANTGIVASSKNASSAVRFTNCVITSAVTNTSTGGSILGQYITVYAIDTSMTNAKSGAWFCTSSAKIIMYGSSSYVGWKHNSAKLYDFRNVTVKIARNKDNLIELTKIGSGTAASNDSYKIYYAFEDTAFSAGTAVEYTGPIADVDYETPVYATVRYTGTSYYGDVTYKICEEYIEGVVVSTADGFASALANGDTPINLTADITLTDLGELAIGTDTKIISKGDTTYTITLDGNTRLSVASGKTANLENVNVIVAETADALSTDWTYGYITVNSSAKLYAKNCSFKALNTNMGTNAGFIRVTPNVSVYGYVELEDSEVIMNAASGSGIALSGSVTDGKGPVFRFINSSVTATVSGAWIFREGTVLFEGESSYSGYTHLATIYDFSNTTIKVVRNKNNLVELSKAGSGAAVNNADYKIYYAFEKSAFSAGTAIEYTEPIADIEIDATIYVALRYAETSFITKAEAKVCKEYIEGVGVATAEEFTAAVANKDPIITLTADITLTDLGLITVSTGTKIQSKTGSTYTITLDGTTRLGTASGSTVTFENFNITIASTIKTVTDLGFTNGWYAGGYIKTGSGAKLYINNCTINCEGTTFATSDAAIIRPYGNDTSYVYINGSTITANLATDKGALLGGQGGIFYITDSYLKAKNGGWDTTDGSGSWLAVSSPVLVLNGDTTVLGYYKAKIRDFRNAAVTAERDIDGNVVLTKTGTGTAAANTNYIIKYSTDNSTYTEYTAPLENISADTTLYVAIYYTGTSYHSTPASLTVPEKVLGDVNGDKVVDTNDLAIIRQCIIGTASNSAADINGDGIIDICDLVMAVNNLS
ncbi:MAG: metallophosphoesterase [Clostridia bacterium]|nr:metallophosphoesterase [Clostridia bacterium]